jgi:glycerol-3-phosphate acyltransferase PlsX
LLLGVNGVCVIAHGSSSVMAITNAIREAITALRMGVNPHIVEGIQQAQAELMESHKDKAKTA